MTPPAIPMASFLAEVHFSTIDFDGCAFHHHQWNQRARPIYRHDMSMPAGIPTPSFGARATLRRSPRPDRFARRLASSTRKARSSALTAMRSRSVTASSGKRGFHGFQCSGRATHPLGTVPQGINDSGEIVGSYVDAAGNRHGFLLEQRRGHSRPRSTRPAPTASPSPRASTTPAKSWDSTSTSTATAMASS